jgi:protein CpxP
MKKLLMVICFVAGIVSLSKAQGGGGGRPQMTPADQVKQLQTIVPTLTADQSSKILTIYTAQTASRDSVMKAGGDRAAMRPLMMAARAKVQALLTDDQKAAYTKYMADHPRGGGGGGGGGTPPPPQK